MSKPTDELMERLERANPVPVGELDADDRRRAAALLERIVAEPMPDEERAAAVPERDRHRPRRRPRPRRIALAGACVAVLGLAVVAALDLLRSDDSGPGGVVERALAAISADDVIYASTTRIDYEIRTLGGGGEVTRERSHQRSWVSTNEPRSRLLFFRVRADGTPGRLEGESVADGERIYMYDPEANRIDVLDAGPPPEKGGRYEENYPGFSPQEDPAARLRSLVDDGRLRVAGRTEVRGRSAYRLASDALSFPKRGIEESRVTYFVDARTYLPLRVRDRTTYSGRALGPPYRRERSVSVVDFLSFRALPDTQANRAKLRLGRHSGAERTPVQEIGEP